MLLKNFTLSILILLVISSCSENNSIEKFSISDIENKDLSSNEQSNYSTLFFCLKNEIGYSNITLKMYFKTKDQKIFNYDYEVYSNSSSDKKCFEIHTSTFLKKGSRDEDRLNVSSLKKGNILELKVEVWTKWDGEKLSERIFTNI